MKNKKKLSSKEKKVYVGLAADILHEGHMNILKTSLFNKVTLYLHILFQMQTDFLLPLC